MQLADFLMQRLDEDEAAARAATPGPWRYSPGKEWHTDPAMLRRAREGRVTFDGEEFVGAGPLDATIGVAATGPSDDEQSMTDAAHIARHDPARVLAEVAAKRAIVAECAHVLAKREGTHAAELAAYVLRRLAAPYADHPDFREE